MSRQKRAAAAGARSRAGSVVALLGGVAVLGAIVLSVTAARPHHPEPRAMDHAGHVVSHERYAAYPRVQEVYRMAAQVPHVLDGLHCYCECGEHSGHYSLLDCFASDHGARCDICLSEAAVAHEMTRQGASLDDIRRAIDDLYRT